MMKNVGASFVKMYVSPSTGLLGFENATSHRQPKFYSPLLGIVFANILLNTALAKFAPLGSLRVRYDSTPWIAYNKPHNNYYDYRYQDSYWKPVTPTTLEGEYGPPNYPPSTSTDAQHVYHHHHVIDSIPGQQQIININNDKHPTEIEIDTNKGTTSNYEDLIPAESKMNTNSSKLAEAIHGKVKTGIGNKEEDNILKTDDLIPSGSSIRRNVYRGTPLRSANGLNFQRNTPNRRNKYQYSNNRRRFRTTTEPNNYFYDNYDYDYGNYDDYNTGRLNSKRKTLQRRPAAFYRDNNENSDYDQNDYNSFDDYTTQLFNRKRPTKSKSKNKNTRKKNKRRQQGQQRQDQIDSNEYEFDEDTEPVTPILRQRRPNNTAVTTTMPTPTTTMNITDIINGSTPSTSNATDYGYGPSNGNENISFTYGPPLSGGGGSHFPSRPAHAYGPLHTSYGVPSASSQYQIPFSEWYSQGSNRHRHHGKDPDIVSLDGFF